MRSVVITGASTGIGWATAKLLLKRGFRVFGSVRKAADADPRWGGAHMLKRLADTREIANAILFLASDDAGLITGSTLTVNGAQYIT